jgi:hypothetical protein
MLYETSPLLPPHPAASNDLITFPRSEPHRATPIAVPPNNANSQAVNQVKSRQIPDARNPYFNYLLSPDRKEEVKVNSKKGLDGTALTRQSQTLRKTQNTKRTRHFAITTWSGSTNHSVS